MTVGSHATGDGCGVAVPPGTERLLDLRALAAHLGVAEGSLHSYLARARGDDTPPPKWWRQPDLQIGNALAWTNETADSMLTERMAKRSR